MCFQSKNVVAELLATMTMKHQNNDRHCLRHECSDNLCPARNLLRLASRFGSVIVEQLNVSLPRVLITLALAGSPMASFAIDTDGDGLDDTIDTDDDNDGIPDSFESTFIPGQGAIEWTHNENGGTSSDGVPTPASGAFTSIGPMQISTGFTPPTTSYSWHLFGANSATLADAKINNDYAEVEFTSATNGVLINAQHAMVGSIYNGTLAGLYETTAEISSDNFTTSTVVYNDGFIDDPAFANYTVSTQTVTPVNILAGISYKVRFYIYNEQNNIHNDFVEWDDVKLTYELNQEIAVDTDGDGIADQLDPDTDGDGIPDAVEGSIDTDGDGISNFRDLDSDNDGILDADESPTLGTDSDNDGIDDYYDVDATNGVDADGDGIDDAIEASSEIDTDGDGIPDQLDDDLASVATSNSASVLSATAVSIDLADNITDANNDSDLNTIDLNPSTTAIESTLITVAGMWVVDSLGVVSFTPNAAFEGTETINYTVSDSAGLVSNIADIIVAVAGATPMASADYGSVANDTNADINLADNVNDANNDIVITSIDINPSTPAIDNTLITAEGVWTVNALGVVTFNPNSAFQGNATISYTVADDDGNVSALADVTVSVAGAIPVVSADTSTVATDTNATINLADNITDANNDVDITTIDLDPVSLGVQNTLTTTDGEWSVDSAGFVTFDPNASFEGLASTQYTVRDYNTNESLPATITVTVEGAPPIATADSTSVLANINATVDLSDNISDANNNVDVTTIDLDTSTPGIQKTITTIEGNWSVDVAGIVSFDPAPAFEGTATIPFTVSDTGGKISAASNISVFVSGAIPIVTNDTTAVPADTIARTDLSDNITDANSDVDITTIDLDPTTPGIQNTITTADGVWAVDSAGQVSFDPDSTFAGTATISYTVSDDDSNVSIPAEIAITVHSASPIANSDIQTTLQNISTTIDVLDSDRDANNDIDVASIDLDPAAAGLQFTIAVIGEGVYEVVAGEVVFTPDTAFTGTSSTDYTVSDTEGNISNIAKIHVTILADTDGDGVANANDKDDDNDGISDLKEGANDTDGDGIIDSLDSDSDNDGITDATEAGGTDIDGDGIVDGFTDIDSDGIDDVIATSPLPLTDSDGDGIPDFQQVNTVPEPIIIPEPAVDPEPVVTPEPAIDPEPIVSPEPVVDLDTDADGIADFLEGVEDTDNDGVADYLDQDSDNDGISDLLETARDTDADGVADFRDLDVDNDGIFDLIEVRTGLVIVNQLDIDNDGMIDFVNSYGSNGMADIVETTLDSGKENYLLLDTDGDGVFDFRDLDSDNDGLLDTTESDHIDLNFNGIIDAVEAIGTRTLLVDSLGKGTDAGGLPRNTDGDVLTDFRDADSDNDGVLDIIESFGINADFNYDGTIDDFVDLDGNGVDDSWQAVTLAPRDSNNDGQADAIELDSDGDGISDLFESGNVDVNNNGTIDDFTDEDGDGVDDAFAMFPLPPTDTDGDGWPDFQDMDSDNDGSTDLEETGGTDANGDGQVDGGLAIGAALPDRNGDGTPDFREVQIGIIRTGIRGSGCSILSRHTADSNVAVAGSIDPTLPAMGFMAILSMALRRRRAITHEGGR